MKRLLLLDDEQNILNALRRCLLHGRASDDQADDELVLECFTSAHKALERLEDNDFDLIISDYRMREMSGVQFLARAIELDPGATRMMMSASADQQGMIAAINDAHVVHFVAKPWTDAALREFVQNTLRARSAGVPLRTTEAVTRINSRLEAECPGITQVERADDGGIILEGLYEA